MLKCLFERIRSRALEWLVKLVPFNISMGAMVLLSVLVLTLPGITKPYIIALFTLGNITFLAYDIALTMLIRLYFLKYRKLLRIEKILK